MSLVVPFLVVDAVLAWMLWHSWHRDEVLGTRMHRRDGDEAVYWLSVGRLALLLLLSVIGTIAAWRAV